MLKYYKTLGLPSNASPQDIKKAYRKLSKQYHPDNNQGSDRYTQQFLAIQEAYEQLTKPSAKPRATQPSYRPKPAPKPTYVKRPVIVDFTIIEKQIMVGVPFTVTWKCSHCDFVEVGTAGRQAIEGRIKTTVQSYRNKAIEIKLRAVNSKYNLSTESVLKIQLNQDFVADRKKEKRRQREWWIAIGIALFYLLMNFIFSE